jgi:G3E family GTPase
MVRIACLGGFLGAGKTTALIEAARNLMARGLRVGVITNDQGSNLVDTALVRNAGLQTEEITGGCFCCRFTEFVRYASRLVQQHRPHIILAEAVGSCTDLAATVCAPLRRFYAAQFELAPLSVFVEPDRVREILGPDSRFEDSVRYLFEKQLLEADHILLSKSDSLQPPEAADLARKIQLLVGKTPVSVMSAKNGTGIREWVDHLLGERTAHSKEIDIDYDIYGQAEASLGWLNATVDLVSEKEFRPAEVAEAVIQGIQERCLAAHHAIAHLKILFVTAEGSDRIALTTSTGRPVWDGPGNLGSVRESSAIINARVAAKPEELRTIVEGALQFATHAQGVSAEVVNLESFAPAPPQRPGLVAT